MLAKTESIALIGSDARLIQVEVDVGTGIPGFTVVGMVARSIKEAEQRVRSALASSDLKWPGRRVVASLAPGALRKEGTHFDLPLALGVLAATQRVDDSTLEGWVVVGELALNGNVRPVAGALAAAMTARDAGRRGLICPAVNAPEAALVAEIEVVPVEHLGQCIDFLAGRWKPPPVTPPPPDESDPLEDMAEVRGHESAKRAAEVAAAGGHNLLMVGPPGSGKSMLAHRIPGILPDMSMDECLEVTRVYSVAGLLAEKARLISQRPFRSPHQHVSLAGLIGGGAGIAKPGEISLAHHGVLFLDELTLYRADALESLRAPLEDGIVHIARSAGSIAYPCHFSLVAAMNPCPCGFLGDAEKACRCSRRQLDIYRSKLSGPLLDRFDIQVTMARPAPRSLLAAPTGESSRVIKERVTRARKVQAARYGATIVTNATVSRAVLDDAVVLTASATSTLRAAVDAMRLSGRGLDRVRRLARTIADLDGTNSVSEDHVVEALGHRAVGHEGVAA